jgi:hypothetical protein
VVAAERDAVALADRRSGAKLPEQVEGDGAGGGERAPVVPAEAEVKPR